MGSCILDFSCLGFSCLRRLLPPLVFVFSCLISSCLVSSCLVFSCPVSSCLASSCLLVSCPLWSCPGGLWSLWEAFGSPLGGSESPFGPSWRLWRHFAPPPHPGPLPPLLAPLGRALLAPGRDLGRSWRLPSHVLQESRNSSTVQLCSWFLRPPGGDLLGLPGDHLGTAGRLLPVRRPWVAVKLSGAVQAWPWRLLDRPRRPGRASQGRRELPGLAQVKSRRVEESSK